MTAYTTILLCERLGFDIYDTIIEAPKAVKTIFGTTASLIPGDKLSVNDLLYGTMLPSGNDAAYTLANFFGEKIIRHKLCLDQPQKYIHPSSLFNDVKGVKSFIRFMNSNAEKLGMNSTFYDSPHGLSNYRNTSTSLD